jgi:hypothetical protein
MTAEPGPTLAQRITELEAAISIAEDRGDYLFAKELRAQVEALQRQLPAGL